MVETTQTIEMDELKINIGKCINCGKMIDNEQTDFCFECSQIPGIQAEGESQMIEIIRTKGFEHELRDCTVRALSLAGNIPYDKVHAVMKKHGRRSRCGFKIQDHIQDVCKDLNLTAKQVKRSGSLNRFLREHPKGKFYCMKHDHCFTVIDGVAHDETKEWSQIKGAWEITNSVHTSKEIQNEKEIERETICIDCREDINHCSCKNEDLLENQENEDD